ncbi:MAG TPA: hypothetical protein VFK02_28155 [Kofleriaceae bacterium]|nr:hypothetical protein [Kofleriaceae bacterium]
MFDFTAPRARKLFLDRDTGLPVGHERDDDRDDGRDDERGDAHNAGRLAGRLD